MAHSALPLLPQSLRGTVFPPSDLMFPEKPRMLLTACIQYAPEPRTSTSNPLDKAWHDDTRNFNMLAMRATLRDLHVIPGELVKTYNWYPDAVSVDALLSPGVPLSLKEILVCYPHHARWQDIMLRLSHNDYRGPDILGVQTFFRGDHQDHMSSSPALNQIQRDDVQRLLPTFKTSCHEGKGDANLCTDQLKPGTYLEKKLKGYTLPTFDDLLHGLLALPQGPDAGPFTQCLAWYLGFCKDFNPKLDFNVLHTQALICALRQASNPVSEQNINQLALQQWRDGGAFPHKGIKGQTKSVIKKQSTQQYNQQLPKPQIVLNIRSDPVDLTLHVNIPIRHVLAFPFLALHGVVAKAFELGIENTERRRAMRKDITTSAKQVSETQLKQRATQQQNRKRQRQDKPENDASAVRMPKRQHLPGDKMNIRTSRTPDRPTVSPITPRMSNVRSNSSPSLGPLGKLELG